MAKIKLRRGLSTSIPSLTNLMVEEGEVLITTDNNKIYVGTGNTDVVKEIGKNPKIIEEKINDLEKQCYLINPINIKKTAFSANNILTSTKIYNLTKAFIDTLENENYIEKSMSYAYTFNATQKKIILGTKQIPSSSFLGGSGGEEGTKEWITPQGFKVTTDAPLSTSATPTLSRFDNLFDGAFGNQIGDIFMTNGGAAGGEAILFDFTSNGNMGMGIDSIRAYPYGSSTRRMDAEIYVSYDGINFSKAGETKGSTKTSTTASDTINIADNLGKRLKKIKFVCLNYADNRTLDTRLVGGSGGYFLSELMIFSYGQITTKEFPLELGTKRILLTTEETIPTGSSGIECIISFDNFNTSEEIIKNQIFENIPAGATGYRIGFKIKDSSELLAYGLSWGE